MGVQATASGNVLMTDRGGFLVTQECIATPLIPVYLAAAIVCCRTATRRALALGAAAPLFVALGVARLLVVALPPALVSSPVFAIHAFYQLLLAAVVVVGAAAWQHGRGAVAWRRALAGGVIGLGFVYLVGAPYTQGLPQSSCRPPLAVPRRLGRFLHSSSGGTRNDLDAFACAMAAKVDLAVLDGRRWSDSQAHRIVYAGHHPKPGAWRAWGWRVRSSWSEELTYDGRADEGAVRRCRQHHLGGSRAACAVERI